MYIFFYFLFLSTSFAFIRQRKYQPLPLYCNDDFEMNSGEVPWDIIETNPSFNEYSLYKMNNYNKESLERKEKKKLVQREKKNKNKKILFLIYILTLFSMIENDEDKILSNLLYQYLQTNGYYKKIKLSLTFFFSFLLFYFKTAEHCT